MHVKCHTCAYIISLLLLVYQSGASTGIVNHSSAFGQIHFLTFVLLYYDIVCVLVCVCVGGGGGGITKAARVHVSHGIKGTSNTMHLMSGHAKESH